MKELSATEIIALWGRIDGAQGQWRNTWEDLARYIHPSKVGFTGEREEGQKKTEYLFDSTALQALDDLGHYLATALTPNSQQWAKLQFKDATTSEMIDVRNWLEDTGNRMQDAWLASNFYKEAGECYQDIGCFGTMCMEGHRKNDRDGNYAGLAFENVYMRECGGIENEYGEIDTTIRLYKKTAIAWYNLFGKASGDAVIGAINASRFDEKFEFLNICYPRDDFDRTAIYLEPVESSRMPFASVWVEMGKKQIVKTSGSYEPTRVIARWDRNTDNTYGHGPGLKALPDVRSLNEAKRLELEWFEKNIDPPLKTRESNIVGNVKVSAGDLTVCRDPEALQELYSNTRNASMTLYKTEELRDSIRNIFYSDLIRDEGLSSRTGVSDYETARRMERAQRILGEAVGGLRNEFLRWVVEKTFSIMYRAGELEEPPESVADEELDVRYVSPLQTAQQAQGAENTALFLAEMAQVAAVQRDLGREPDVLDRIDFDKMSKKMADARNVPADILRSDEEVQTLRDARAAARARAAALAETESAASAASDLGQAVGADNAMELITGGQAQAS